MKKKRSVLFGFIVTALLFPVLSCSPPIDMTLLKDKIPPKITITSPKEGSACANVVRVSGQVTDKKSGEKEGQIKKFFYEVPKSSVRGNIAVKSDNSFAFRFITTDLPESFTLNLTAIDANGNSTTEYLPLHRFEENTIPSFQVTPGNKEVTLKWKKVPGVESYTIYYTDNNGLPSEVCGTTLENVTSPFVLTGLENGAVYTFVLKTVPKSGWPESRSGFIRTIPLSPQTLAPIVNGEYGQIRIEWSSIPCADKYGYEYEVWKALSLDDEYRNISGPLRVTEFVDTSTENGTWYYYKVKPVLEGTELSTFNGAETDPFPFPVKFPLYSGRCNTPGNANSVYVNGNFAYT